MPNAVKVGNFCIYFPLQKILKNFSLKSGLNTFILKFFCNQNIFLLFAVYPLVFAFVTLSGVEGLTL